MAAQHSGNLHYVPCYDGRTRYQQGNMEAHYAYYDQRGAGLICLHTSICTLIWRNKPGKC